MHIQDDNIFLNNMMKLYENEDVMSQQRQPLFDSHWNSIDSLVG